MYGMQRFMIRTVRAISLLMALALSVHAHAQGTQGIAPDPISTQRLEQYLAWYLPDATPAQLIAIDAAHEEYLIAFRRIRNGEIAQLLERVGVTPQSVNGMEELFRTVKQVERTVSEADDAFAAALCAIVGIDASDAVRRVREARERECLSASQMMSIGGSEASVDLTQIVAAERLPEDVKRAALALLADYDIRATQAVRQLSRESQEFGVKYVTAMMELQKGQDPASRDWSQWEVVRKELVDKEGGALERARRSMTQNVQAGVESLRGVLEPGAWHSVASMVASRMSSGMVPMNVVPTVGAAMQRVLRKPDLDLTQRESVLNLQREWTESDFRQMQKALDSALTGSPMMFAAADAEKQQEELQAAEARRTEIAQAAWDKLAAILGAESLSRYVNRQGIYGEEMPYGAVNDDEEFRIQTATQAQAAEDEMRAANGTARHSFNFRPISARELAEVIEFVLLTDAERTIVEQAHSAYTTRFTEQLAEALTRATLAQSNLWANMWQPHVEESEQAVLTLEVSAKSSEESDTEDASAQVAAPTSQHQPPRLDPGRFAECVAAQMAALDLALAVDAEFAADCAAVLGAAASTGEHRIAAMLRSIRVLDLAANSGTLWENPSEAIAVTPLAMSQQLELEDAARIEFASACAVALSAQMNALQSIARARYEGARRGEFVWWESSSSDDASAAQARYAASQLKDRSLALEGMVAVTAALDAALATLPASAVENATRVKRKLANPGVFKDPRDATPLLRAALALEGLDEARKGQIEAVFAEYEMLYDDACERLLQLAPVAIEANMTNEAWAAYTTRTMEFERLKFERGERAAKAISSIRRILGKTDAVRVPGLAGYQSGTGQPQGQWEQAH